MGEQFNLFLKPCIDRDLSVRVVGAVEQCKPSAKMLFDCNNGRGQWLGLIIEARAQESSSGGVFLKLGEVVGIKHLHDFQAVVGFLDTPCPGSRLP